MEDHYLFTDSEIRELRDSTQTAHDTLVDVSVLVEQLTADMANDTTWAGHNKDAFMAWMDLLRQYHAKMAEPTLGAAAVEALDDFQNKLANYYQNSAAYRGLGGVR